MPILFTLLAFCATLFAAETRELGSRVFERDPSGWTQIDPTGFRYAVDPHVITIRFRADVSETERDNLHPALGATVLRHAITGFADVEIASNQDVFDAIDSYMASGLVDIAEPNTIGAYGVEPDDPSYGSQWFLPVIAAPLAWDTTGGLPVAVVAVLDSGTEFTHDDLGMGADGYQNVWLNPGEDAWSDPTDPGTGNGLDDDGNGFVDDWKGWNFGNGNNNPAGANFHGTSVAGVVAAKTHNATGVAGVAGGWNAPGAQVLIAGVGNAAPLSSVLDDAILYSAELGANVIQLSLTVGQTAAIDAAIEMARTVYNMSVVCSSGNDFSQVVGYPSIHPRVISVGATNQMEERAEFSNYGPDIEISAPGTNILTTTLGNGYAPTGGTSFSSPIISAVIAMMLSVRPDLDSVVIRQILKDTADKVGGYDYNWDPMRPGHSFELGYGRVNAAAAIQAALAAPSGFVNSGFESGIKK